MSKRRLLLNSVVLVSMVLSLFSVPVLAAPAMAQTATTTCTDVSLYAMKDTYVNSVNPTYNYGGANLFKVSGYSSTNRGALLKWDVSSIPPHAAVSSASLTLYVSTAASKTYNLYNMRRSWVEGTGSGSVTGDGATWRTYDGTHTWGTFGAASTIVDRYNTNLWGANTSTFSSTGSKTVSLNTHGVAVVQGWIAGTASNYGLTMQNYSSSTASDDLRFSSSENTTKANRPKLNVTYCVITGPTITNSGTLSAFSSNIGVASAEQTYTVAGRNLTDNLLITAPTDFQISTTSGSGWGSSISLTPTHGTVTTTVIYVRFLRSTAGTCSGNIAHTSTGATTQNVAVSGTATNQAPGWPVLAQPLNGATNVSTSPTLEVTVTDQDADSMSVSFYGRPVSEGTGEDFTLVAIPDPQNYASSYPAIYTGQTQWIVDNKTTSNIVFATAVGDLVNTSSSTTEYGRADAAFDILDTGNVTYSVGPGNHDMHSGTLWASYFGVARFSGKSWFGGSYDDYNAYSLFSASGMDFILINLQYSPTTAQLDWAEGLMNTYSTRRAIVESHSILNIDDTFTTEGTTIYNALRDHNNLFLMLCGHRHSSSDGAAYVAGTGTGTAGQTIHIVMADYQEMTQSGYLRILRFSPADDMLHMTTYSPNLNAYITTSPDKMDLPYDMAGSAAAYTLIGTVTGVTSGSNASISWSGRSANTEYQWYAVVSDGSLTTTSSTWSFTTGTLANNPPVITEGSSTDVTVSEDGSPNPFSLTLNATDADSDTLTWSISSPASHGTVSASGTGTSKAIGYTPHANYNGSDSFVVQVSDGNGGTDTITVNVTIQPVNDAPMLGAIGNKSVTELTLLSFTAFATDIDVPADALTFSLVDVPSGAAIDPSTGAFSWTPTEAQGPGSYTFTVKVCDNGTPSLCDEEEITVTVSKVIYIPFVASYTYAMEPR